MDICWKLSGMLTDSSTDTDSTMFFILSWQLLPMYQNQVLTYGLKYYYFEKRIEIYWHTSAPT